MSSNYSTFLVDETSVDSTPRNIAGHARLLAAQDWDSALEAEACAARDQILRAIATAADHVRQQLAGHSQRMTAQDG